MSALGRTEIRPESLVSDYPKGEVYNILNEHIDEYRRHSDFEILRYDVYNELLDSNLKLLTQSVSVTTYSRYPLITYIDTIQLNYILSEDSIWLLQSFKPFR